MTVYRDCSNDTDLIKCFEKMTEMRNIFDHLKEDFRLFGFFRFEDRCQILHMRTQ